MHILEYILSGLLFGSTYSLVAIGFTIIFGVLHRLNIAHGATIMVSAFAGATVSLLLGGDSYAVLALSFVVSVVTGAVLGVLIERVIFRPLRNASYLAPFVATVGITMALEEAMQQVSRRVPIFYPEYTPYPSPLEDLSFHLGEVYIRGAYVVIFAVSLMLMVLLHLWVTRSSSGRAMRIVEENPTAARLLGINVERTEMVAFAVASALAGAAGCLIGVSTGTINAYIGAPLLLTSFVVIVIGGLGNLYGAMFGGLFVGVVQILTTNLLSASYKEAVLFILMFIVLIVRPQGLFGGAVGRPD
ncbi:MULTISPECIES: branched-chain amino acid ABC transporter permease [unclassified Caballeronia]|uniref:branched-chain amino acid ABC transporter permease n=1 Tax=unclassified Caballeronia TaxID=2646786 RepID=UPI002857CF0B|nr:MULTISPECIES: branched-chain amino acid ABC transporter permease [unclassified Caballeronia]MDR5823647.1 branched-chain amino acid ABC transporter permease [Caballeronia sp. LZ043]MDR5881557.1 branched-chain amino acid ABC transporter permease [Caballeronia sp. LZ032]